jgi:hypothetical protein
VSLICKILLFPPAKGILPVFLSAIFRQGVPISNTDKDGAAKYCYTQDNTGIASPRIFIPLLELYQQEDGSIKIPKAL